MSKKMFSLFGVVLVAAASLCQGQINQKPVPAKQLVVTSIYVADPNANRIVRMPNLTGNSWQVLTGPMLGTTFMNACSVSTDSSGRIYFLEGTTLHRVDNITGAGHVSMPITVGSGVPKMVRVRSNGWIYIADAFANVYAYDTVSATATLKWAGAAGGVLNLRSMAVDPTGNVFVACDTIITSNSAYPGLLVRISATGSNPIAYYGPSSSQQFSPSGISLDAAGKIYFSDASSSTLCRINNISGGGLVQCPTSQGPWCCQWAGAQIYFSMPSTGKVASVTNMQGANLKQWGTVGTGNNQFSAPYDMSIHYTSLAKQNK